MRPLMLDLFCKAGGAAAGYYCAGFEVVGVDIEPQPNYPFEFHQADALDILHRLIASASFEAFGGEPGRSADAVHASPPCQAYTTGGRVREREQQPRLIEPVRELLVELGLPYAIENVEEAPLEDPVRLCGSMFGLKVKRHRLFEVSFPCERPVCTSAMHEAQRPIVGVYGRPHGKAGAWPGMLPSTHETWSAAMGIDWMTTEELSQAIPPAYTQWIGERMKRAVMANRGEAVAAC